jgi:hypothetical protein
MDASPPWIGQALVLALPRTLLEPASSLQNQVISTAQTTVQGRGTYGGETDVAGVNAKLPPAGDW